jgi:transcriptional regulator with XRE-family HTH domain
MEKIIHQGRNVKRFREMLGIKQEALAVELGDDWNQRKISLLEQKELIEEELLERVAKVLKVPPEALKSFDDEKVINIISNNSFENCAQPASTFFYSIINPFEKWVDTLEENRKLYSALLKEKDEKIQLLEQLLEAKK